MSQHDYDKLVQEIRKHDRLYYVESKPIISDYDYDMLFKKLEKMESDHPEWVTAASSDEAAVRAFLSDLSHFTPILATRSAPLKQILEHILLTFPKMPGASTHERVAL